VLCRLMLPGSYMCVSAGFDNFCYSALRLYSPVSQGINEL